MLQFAYKTSTDEVINSLIDSSLELARACYEGKAVPDYMDKNKVLLEAMGKKMVEGTRYEAEYDTKKLSVFSNPMVRNNGTVRDNFNAVIAQVVNAVVPAVINDEYSKFIAEVHHVGFGETARFIIESNDLFKVNKKGEGVRKGVDQPMYNDEITVNAEPLTIDAGIDWYPFIAGQFDMGNFALKIARSYSAYIFLQVIKGMTQATSTFGAAYTVNGVSTSVFATLRDRVSAANGGMPVVAIGTTAALANCSLSGNYQVQIGEEMNKVGYLDQYLNVPLIGLNNVLVPGTVNGAATLALPDNRIYLIPVGGAKPVKIVVEGDEVAVSYNPETTSDKHYGLSVELRIGVQAVCGHKYGTITLG